MAHFAKVENGIVTQVIVIDQETLNTGHWGDPTFWVQTSYNTVGNVNTREGGVALHKNYAGIGYTWDGTGFAAPQPYASWSKDADTYLWEAPVAMPTEEGKFYTWNEATTSWVEAPAL